MKHAGGGFVLQFYVGDSMYVIDLLEFNGSQAES